MITEEQKSEWISALRSGKYRQAKGQLKRETPGVGPSYCCLGVLASAVLNKEPSVGVLFTYLDNDVVPSAAQRYLSSMNDRGKSFSEIAIAIERMDLDRSYDTALDD